MFDKLLLSALVLVQFHYGSAQVITQVTAQVTAQTTTKATLHPSLAKIVPQMKLPEESINCFNNYWSVKESLDSELREQWNCTKGCPKGPECCISYNVLESLSDLQFNKTECSPKSLGMVAMFLPMALARVKQRCEPEFKHDSNQCILMLEEILPPVPTTKGDTCPRKVCACY